MTHATQIRLNFLVFISKYFTQYTEKSIDVNTLDYLHNMDTLQDLKSHWYTTLSVFLFA